jgi:MoaA/NifB/PqqE/SkfB family radical SAM enzyme
MFLLSLTATCQVCTVSLKAGLYTYNRFTCRALKPPDREPTQADTGIMGVAGQAPTATTGRLVGKLKAQGEEKGHHTFDKGLAISQELKVGRFVLKINGNGAVVPCPFARLSHMSSRW